MADDMGADEAGTAGNDDQVVAGQALHPRHGRPFERDSRPMALPDGVTCRNRTLGCCVLDDDAGDDRPGQGIQQREEFLEFV
jgi:hypothetical protein